MNLNEFKFWFDGFTDGKDTLSNEDMEKIRQKLTEVIETSKVSDYPSYPNIPLTPIPVYPAGPYWDPGPSYPGYTPCIPYPIITC